jgi:Zn ribbon nucleic-acid-binding protein
MSEYSDKGAICPHCKKLNDPNDDMYSLYSEDTYEWECAGCGKTFSVTVCVSYAWSTEPLEDEEDEK